MSYRVLALATLLAACSSPDVTSKVADPVEADAEAGEAPDAPEAALAWRRLRWQDENGVFDPFAIRAARAQRAANAQHHATLENAGIGRFAWVERGPFNIGGRTRSLVINPGNANELWAGAVGGGVWHTTDGGANWAPVNDWLGNLAVCSLALVPGAPPTIYAGTGEGFHNGDALAGEGIFKSTDGGVTFTQLLATAGFSHVNRIAVHPTNPSIVLASVRSGGIYRSTNAGASWSLVRSCGSTGNSLQVLFDPNDGNKCVADIYEGSQHRVVYSTNAGATWTNAASGLIGQAGISGRIELAYARSVANMVYASCGTSGGLIWRSTDGGVNWTVRTTGTGSGAAWYYNALWVDPFDANFVVTGAYHCYKSTNGGTTLTRISNGYINDNGPHPDVHGFIPDPGYNGTTNNKVWVVTDGGVYVTTNIKTASTTSGWSRRDNRYRASQFYGAAGHGASGRINGGTQDNGSLTLQSGATSAQLTYGGDGGYAAIDWNNPLYIYGEYVYAEMHRSSNGGTSASTIDAGLLDSGTAANFIAPFILDPNDPTRLLVGGASLWRTSNARAATVAWSAIKASVGSNISAIAVAPGNANVVWVGHNDGRIYKTANGLAAAPTWTAVDANGAPNPLPNRFVERIAIDPTNANKVWVALGGFSPDNLWLSTNGGTTFVDRTGSGVMGLPDAPIHGLCLHPTLAGRVYAGTEVGMFASHDDGLTWSTSNEGPVDTSVEEVVFMHGTTRLLVATHGRGLWTIDVREPAVTTLGAGCAGTAGVPVLGCTPPRLGQSVTASISTIPNNAFCILVVGFDITSWNGNPLPMPLDVLGMTGCVGRVRPDLTVSGLAAGAVFSTSFPVLPNPATLGTSFWAQGLVVDAAANPGGAVVSNGLTLTIGN